MSSPSVKILNLVTAHWLFYPFLLLLFLIISHVVFFSSNGYFAYKNKSVEKTTLQKQIRNIEKTILELKQKKKASKSDI